MNFLKASRDLTNQICDSSFLTGYVDEVQVIDESILREVMKESPMQQFVD